MRTQVSLLGVKVDAITAEQTVEKLAQFLEGKGPKKVFTPNPEIVMLAQEDQELFTILNEADLVLPDGIGLIIGAKIKGLALKERVTGVDTMDQLLSHCGKKGKSIFILGGKPGVAELACKNIEKKFSGIRIAGFQHGYFTKEEEAKIVETINQSNTDVLFVCLGAPRQEKWIHHHARQLTCSIAMGVGGSVDIYAGVANRAPVAFQKLGLEWFYRLMKEPWRYKRMLALPKFLWVVLSTPQRGE